MFVGGVALAIAAAPVAGAVVAAELAAVGVGAVIGGAVVAGAGAVGLILVSAPPDPDLNAAALLALTKSGIAKREGKVVTITYGSS